MTEILELKNVSKKFGESYAVKNLSFSMHQGEIVGFLGPNGAGKSTTMKMITGFLKPSEGEIFFQGENIRENLLKVKSRIGYLPEQNPLYYEMFVREFLEFTCKLYGVSRKEIPGKVERTLQAVGLSPEAHKTIGQLSKGYKQRVGIAHAIISDPEIIILDEPTSGLDPNQVIEIRNLIREIGKQKTILFSSHILSEVEQIADRVIIINKGEKLLDEPMETLQQKFGQGERIKVKFEKPGFPQRVLREKAKHLEVLSETEFEISVAEGEAFRKFIYRKSTELENPILLLEVEKMSLESIFKKLTQEN